MSRCPFDFNKQYVGNKTKMQAFLVIAITTVLFPRTEALDNLSVKGCGLFFRTIQDMTLHGEADYGATIQRSKSENQAGDYLKECEESSVDRAAEIGSGPSNRILVQAEQNHLGLKSSRAGVQAEPLRKHFRRKLYANVDWTHAEYYDTSKAVVVGTNLYYITRGVDGLFIEKFSTLTSTWESLPQFNWLTDADGWNVEMRYATIRAASVGSKLYVFGRGGTGTYLSQLDTATGTWTVMPTFAFLRDADGYTLPQFYQTVRMVSCGTSLYITCRGNNQLNIASFDTSTSTWTLRPVLYQFVDDATWSQYMYYATFRLAADSVNTLWLFCRGPLGINLAPYLTAINTWGSLVTYAFFDDANWFYYPRFFETIDIVPYSTRVHIISRGFCCIYQYYYNTITSTFTVGSTLNSYSDAEGWTEPEYYMTMKFTVCNNVLYVDGRGQSAVFSTKYTFDGWNAAAAGANMFTDADGWNAENNYRSLRCVCIGSKIYYVGRKEAVVHLAVYDTVTDSWSSVPEFFYPCYNTCKDCSGSSSTSCTQCYPFSHLQAASPAACVCDSHYFAAPPACTSCSGQCAECSGSSASQCTQCPANAALTSTAPSTCKCASGSYFDASNVCTACHQRCQECATGGITQCTQCKSSSHLQSPPLSECVCDTGFYFNGSNVCASCHATCKECSGGGVSDCTQCKANASLTTPPTSPCECAAGHYMDATSTCAQCHPSCADCSGSGTGLCTVCPAHAHLASPPTSSCDCDSGYLYDIPSTSCLSCHSSCAACAGNGAAMCTSCPAHSYLSNPPTSSCVCSSGYYMATPAYLCTLCDPSCQLCSGGTASSCTQCRSNAHLTTPPTSTCECNTGYIMNASSVCALCDPTCAACTTVGATFCTQCPSNSALVTPPVSECKCNSGYYREANNVCTLCHARCKECTGGGVSQCTDCNANSQLDTPPVSQCSCVSGFFFDVSDICLACHQSCTECDGGAVSECTQCKSNAALTTSPPSPCACSSGFFMVTPTYTCALCDSSCQFCTDGSASSCTQCYSNSHLAAPPASTCICNTGFYMNAASACVQCDPTCAACSSAGSTTCTQCPANSALISPPMSACSCSSGYYREASNACTQCHSRCKECSAGGASDCTQCKSNAALLAPPTSGCQCSTGYYMDASGLCQTCSSPCTACTSAGTLQCTQCIPNANLLTPPTSACECNSGLMYDPSSSSCVSCHPDCLACSGAGPNMCTSCKANAHLQTPPTSTCICDSGFFMSASGICNGCYSACLTCSGIGPSDCLSCKGNLVLSDPPNPSQCVCPPHNYPVSANICGACYETCDLCSGPLINHCTQCRSNSSLQVNGTCLCDEKHFWNKETSACEECHFTCIQCNGNAQANCLQCYSNAYISHTSVGVCLCNPGFYPLSGNVANCNPCPPLCSICSSFEECIECSDNAVIVSNGVCGCSTGFFYDPDNIICKVCPKGCASCIFDNLCSTCKNEFKLFNNLCVETCPSGYIENGLKCVPEPPVPSLTVDTSNTLTLTFSKKVSKEMENTDIELSVIDLDGTRISLSWSISAIDSFHSFNIPLVFYQVKPPDNSTLYLLFLSPSDFCDENGTPMAVRTLNVTLYPFPKDIVVDSSKSPTNSQAATTASTIAQSGIVTTSVISILSGNPTGFFGLLNQLQLITYIPLMDLELPEDLFYTLIGLNANGFSINPFDNAFQSERKATQPKINAQNYGFTSTLFLKNSGFIAFSLVAVALAYLAVLFLSKCRFSPVIAIYFSGIKEKFYWGVPMRLWIQLYLDVGVNSLLQFSRASDFDWQWDQVNAAEVRRFDE